MGEQFGSRSITQTPTGATGTRIFLVDWNKRYDAPVPKIADPWPDEKYDPWSPLVESEALWVESITPTPEGMSSTSKNEAATKARVVVMYGSSMPMLIDPSTWRVTTQASIQAVQVGMGRVFKANPTHKIEGGQTLLLPTVEIVIRGVDGIPETKEKDPGYLAKPSHYAQNALGFVCSEKYLDTKYPTGQILFEAEEYDEPFPRRYGNDLMWYRQWTRRFLWRLNRSTYLGVPNYGAHNHLYDTQAKRWDEVVEPLYQERPFKFPDFPLFPGLI